MAKSKPSQSTLPFKTEFIVWLEDNGFTHRSASSYASYINTLNRRVLRAISSEGVSAIDVYPHHIAFDDFMQAMNRYLDITGSDAAELETHKTTLAKCRSALSKYIVFLQKESPKLKGTEPEPVDPCDFIPEACLSDSLTFDKSALMQNFSFRLSTQHRLTGVEVLLPLGLIRRIFTQLKKPKETNRLDQWAARCAKRVVIHIDGYKSGSVSLTDIIALHINPQSGEVAVTIKGKRYAVNTYNSTKTEPMPMRATSLSGIHIDHAVPIEELLSERSFTKDLTTLQLLTNWLMEAKGALLKNINKYKREYFNYVIERHSADLPCIADGLIHDLDKIAVTQGLQLMGAKENLQAGKKYKNELK